MASAIMAAKTPKHHFLLLLTLVLLLLPSSISAATSPAPKPSPAKSPASSGSSSTLDPKQLRALQSLSVSTSKDPCSPQRNSTTVCDAARPFRHLISLKISNCSDDVALSLTALKSLSTLKDLEFINCPIAPIRFPSDLIATLRSFSAINSLKKLSGVWLSHLQNLTDLTVTQVSVSASGPGIILNNIKNLKSVTISHANLTGFLPKHFQPNLTVIDLSGNKLKGRIPSAITQLENLVLLNLSSNSLNGTIPASFGDLASLKNVSLSSNSLSGPIPESLAAIPELVHLDLSSNQLNGTIPDFISDMKFLKFLNLEKNNFKGVLPFNVSFIKRLSVLKIGENSNLCYNHTTLSSSKLKLGIAQCDKHGLPIPPPAPKGNIENDSSDEDYTDDDDEPKQHRSHGPNKVVLGIAITLSVIVFLIVLLIMCSRCCR